LEPTFEPSLSLSFNVTSALEGGRSAIFRHFTFPFPSPNFLLSLSPALGLFRGAATFLGAFAFLLPAWSVLSLSALNCVVRAFGSFEIIAAAGK
jgi:hypothetical protein